MKLPAVDQPDRLRGLYVFDFGEWSAVGYTAEEIAILLEDTAYRMGKVYKIVRSAPDGRMELRGVPRERFEFESGMFFNRDDLAAARADFAALLQISAQHGAPCRAYLHLADRGVHEGVARYVTALIYPAEYEDDMAAWLLATRFMGGSLVEGGISHVGNYHAEEKTILDRQPLSSKPAVPSRSADEVLGSVRRAVQR